MRLLYLSALLILVACRHYQVDTVHRSLSSGPAIQWKTDIEWDEARTTVAGGKVWLLIDGHPFLISEDAVGNYSPIEQADYASHKVPPDALSASRAWWAGNGQTLYVIRQKDELLVYSREYSEVGPRDPPYSLIKLIRYDKKS